MAFDPDAYLAEEPESTFDPDAYLAEAAPAPVPYEEPSMMSRVGENIVSGAHGLQDMLLGSQGASDILAGGVPAAIGALMPGGESPGEAYGRGIAEHQASRQHYQTAAPTAAMVPEAASLASGVGAVPSLVRGGTRVAGRLLTKLGEKAKNLSGKFDDELVERMMPEIREMFPGEGINTLDDVATAMDEIPGFQDDFAKLTEKYVGPPGEHGALESMIKEMPTDVKSLVRTAKDTPLIDLAVGGTAATINPALGAGYIGARKVQRAMPKGAAGSALKSQAADVVGEALTKKGAAMKQAKKAPKQHEDISAFLNKNAPRLRKWQPILDKASGRGVAGQGATHYMLMQTDEEYRKAIREIEEKESE